MLPLASPFLGACDLARLGCASTELQVICGQAGLWETLLKKDFFGFRPGHALQGCPADAKAAYTLRARARSVRMGQEASFVGRRAALEQLHANRKWFTALMDLVHVRVLVPIIAVGLLLLTIFIPARMDGSIHWSSWSVLSPLWIMFGAGSIAMASAWTASRKRNDVDSLAHNVFGRGNDVLAWFVVARVLNHHPVALASGAVLAVALFLFFVLVAHNSESNNLPWASVFAPLWVAFLVVCCAPCLRWFDHHQALEVFHVLVIFFIGPALVTCILACVRLAGEDLPLSVVFIPLWIINGLMLCVPCLLFLVTLGLRAAHRIQEGGQMQGATAFCTVTWCLVLPWFLFQLLFCIHEAHPNAINARGAFAPIIVWQAVVTWVLLMYAKNRRRLRPAPRDVLDPLATSLV